MGTLGPFIKQILQTSTLPAELSFLEAQWSEVIKNPNNKKLQNFPRRDRYLARFHSIKRDIPKLKHLKSSQTWNNTNTSYTSILRIIFLGITMVFVGLRLFSPGILHFHAFSGSWNLDSEKGPSVWMALSKVPPEQYCITKLTCRLWRSEWLQLGWGHGMGCTFGSLKDIKTSINIAK